MKTLLVALLSFIYLNSSNAKSCLTELEIKKAWRLCKLNTDCAIYKDGCRSCGDLIVVNKIHLQTLSDYDYSLRKKNNCNIACEACGTPANFKAECKNNLCQDYKRK
jgi:hypothetical protein